MNGACESDGWVGWVYGSKLCHGFGVVAPDSVGVAVLLCGPKIPVFGLGTESGPKMLGADPAGVSEVALTEATFKGRGLGN